MTARQSPHGIGLIVITDDMHQALEVADREVLGHFQLPFENPDHYVERLKKYELLRGLSSWAACGHRLLLRLGGLGLGETGSDPLRGD